jgi:hypothetical protein
MTFKGVYWISVMAQRQQILVAPLVFLWIFAVHAILSVEVAPLTALLIGAVIAVYQQFSSAYEDLYDGFFDHCRFNGVSYLSYALAKAFSVWLTILLPMALVLLVFGIDIVASALITSQWALLSVCIACLMTLVPKANPLNLLLAWLPLLIAPIIFLIDYLHNCNENSLLIFFGCDIILMCSACLPFYFNNKV